MVFYPNKDYITPDGSTILQPPQDIGNTVQPPTIKPDDNNDKESVPPANEPDATKSSLWNYRTNWNDWFNSLDLSDPNDLFKLSAYEHIGSEVTGADLDLEIARRKELINNAFQQFNLQYNSEMSRLKRLQSIGMNPQIVGGLQESSTAESSSYQGGEAIGAAAQQNEIAQQQQELAERQYRTNLIFSAVDSIFGVVTNLFSMGTGIANFFTDLATKKQNLRNLQKVGVQQDMEIANSTLKNINDAAAFAESIVMGQFANSKISTDIEQLDSSSVGTLLDSSNIQDFGKWTGNPVADKAIAQQIQNYRNNPVTLQKAWESYRDSERARRDTLSEVDTYGLDVKEIQKSLSPLIHLNLKTKMSLLRFQNEEAEIKRKYISAINVDNAAASFNSATEATRLQSELNALDFKRKLFFQEILKDYDDLIGEEYKSILDGYRRKKDINFWKTTIFNFELQSYQTMNSLIMGNAPLQNPMQHGVDVGTSALKLIGDFIGGKGK